MTVPLSHSINPSGLAWTAIGDPVMGGCSISRVCAEGTAIRFEGVLSLARGGGFASLRATLPTPPPADCDRLCLQVRGDGRRYKLGLGRRNDPNDTQWQCAFETGSGPVDALILPLTDFVRVRRGRLVQPELRVRPEQIDRIGLTLADGQPGRFVLHLLSLAFLPG